MDLIKNQESGSFEFNPINIEDIIKTIIKYDASCGFDLKNIKVDHSYKKCDNETMLQIVCISVEAKNKKHPLQKISFKQRIH